MLAEEVYEKEKKRDVHILKRRQKSETNSFFKSEEVLLQLEIRLVDALTFIQPFIGKQTRMDSSEKFSGRHSSHWPTRFL